MKQVSTLLLLLTLLACTKQRESATSAVETDPYLWLEDVESEKSLEWVRAQNKLSDDAIITQPLYKELNDKLVRIFNDKDQIIYPELQGEYVYNLWQDEKNERGLWRRMPKSDYIKNKQVWETVLDLDKLSAEENKKWVFRDAQWLEPHRRYCLITLSDGGKDESVVREYDGVTKEFVMNGFSIEESKGGASWIDANTLAVSSNFGSGTLSSAGYPVTIKTWKRGVPLESATLLYQADTTVAAVWPMSVFRNNQYEVFATVWKSAFESELYLSTADGMKKIDYPLDANMTGRFKDELILALHSDWVVSGSTYKTGSVVSMNLSDFLKGKTTVSKIYVPDKRSSFISMSSSKDFIIMNIMENVKNKLLKFQLTGGQWSGNKIAAPDAGSIALIASDDTSNDVFFRYNDLITPTSLYYFNNNDLKVIKTLKGYFDTNNLVVEQFEATSRDGTKVPYFVVHRKDIAMDGNNPTLMYAYGGFNVAEQPNYSGSRGIGWIERGGVYVLANVRGGGEFGPEWHKSAMKEKRQNAYDDFYAVSEDIISRKISSPPHLGAFGWSNGGLLAGVVLTQRPDLYNAVVIGAPLLDMKRYSQMLAGASWMAEYGDPSIPAEWEYLSKYSPYHNISREKKYPQALFVTSTKDDRVHPGHARKMAAKMTDLDIPFYYHETIEGGHGAASTNNQEAAIWAMIYTYLDMKLQSAH